MVLICWGVIYERRQGMLRIEYRYKCPTVVRGRQSSPTTLDLESNSPQRSQASCSGHSYHTLVYNTESAKLGPPVIDQLKRLHECALPTIWNTVVVVRVTSALNK